MTEREASFAGRVALILGAGSPTGIGFAAARLLGRRGARVVVDGGNTIQEFKGPSEAWY